MLSLTLYTWIRFFVWFAIGFTVYFFYGIGHSHENKGKLWLPCIEFTRMAKENRSEDTKL